MKKSLKDLGVGTPLTLKFRPRGLRMRGAGIQTLDGHDYSHLLTEEQRRNNPDLKLFVHEPAYNEKGHHTIDSYLVRTENGYSWPIGEVNGSHNKKHLTVSFSEVDEDYHKQGLGKKLYEAILAHAFNVKGLKTVGGSSHATGAHRVHNALARDHAMSYAAQPNIKGRKGYDSDWGFDNTADWEGPPAPFDDRYGKYKYHLKSEEVLEKALDEIKHRDIRVIEDGNKRKAIYDYSHLLPPEAKGYRLDVEKVGSRLSANFYHNGMHVGSVDGNISRANPERLNIVVAHTQPDHRRKGLGSAAYEALLAHAANVEGCSSVKGSIHTIFAHNRHRQIAEKHGLAYEAAQLDKPMWPKEQRDNFIQRFGSYEYDLKPQALAKTDGDPIEAALKHGSPEERLMALKMNGVGPQHLLMCMGDRSPRVKKAIFHHPQFNQALLEQAPKSWIRTIWPDLLDKIMEARNFEDGDDRTRFLRTMKNVSEFPFMSPAGANRVVETMLEGASSENLPEIKRLAYLDMEPQHLEKLYSLMNGAGIGDRVESFRANLQGIPHSDSSPLVSMERYDGGESLCRIMWHPKAGILRSKLLDTLQAVLDTPRSMSKEVGRKIGLSRYQLYKFSDAWEREMGNLLHTLRELSPDDVDQEKLKSLLVHPKLDGDSMSVLVGTVKDTGVLDTISHRLVGLVASGEDYSATNAALQSFIENPNVTTDLIDRIGLAFGASVDNYGSSVLRKYIGKMSASGFERMLKESNPSRTNLAEESVKVLSGEAEDGDAKRRAVKPFIMSDRETLVGLLRTLTTKTENLKNHPDHEHDAQKVLDDWRNVFTADEVKRMIPVAGTKATRLVYLKPELASDLLKLATRPVPKEVELEDGTTLDNPDKEWATGPIDDILDAVSPEEKVAFFKDADPRTVKTFIPRIHKEDQSLFDSSPEFRTVVGDQLSRLHDVMDRYEWDDAFDKLVKYPEGKEWASRSLKNALAHEDYGALASLVEKAPEIFNEGIVEQLLREQKSMTEEYRVARNNHQNDPDEPIPHSLVEMHKTLDNMVGGRKVPLTTDQLSSIAEHAHAVYPYGELLGEAISHPNATRAMREQYLPDMDDIHELTWGQRNTPEGKKVELKQRILERGIGADEITSILDKDPSKWNLPAIEILLDNKQLNSQHVQKILEHNPTYLGLLNPRTKPEVKPELVVDPVTGESNPPDLDPESDDFIAANQHSSILQKILKRPDLDNGLSEKLFDAVIGDRVPTWDERQRPVFPNESDSMSGMRTALYRNVMNNNPQKVLKDRTVNIRYGTQKLRRMRDLILDSGAEMVPMAQLPKGDWEKYRVITGDPKQDRLKMISANKIQEAIDKTRVQTHHYSADHLFKWGDPHYTGQRHADKPSNVFLLYLRPDQIQRIKDSGLWAHYRDIMGETGLHPDCGSNALGWIRYTGEPEKGWVHVDEDQSDIRVMPAHMAMMKAKKRLFTNDGFNKWAEVPPDKQAIYNKVMEDYKKEHAEELDKDERLHKIIFEGNDPHELIAEGFHSFLYSKFGRVKIHWPGLEMRATLSRLDGYPLNTGTSLDTERPLSMIDNLINAARGARQSHEKLLARQAPDKEADPKGHKRHTDQIASSEKALKEKEEALAAIAKRVGKSPGGWDNEEEADMDEEGNPVDSPTFSLDREAPAHYIDTYQKLPQKMGMDIDAGRYGEMDDEETISHFGNMPMHVSYATKKEEQVLDLRKSIDDLPKGKVINQSADHVVVDMSHLLGKQHLDRGYSLRVTLHKRYPNTYSENHGYINADLFHKGESVGGTSSVMVSPFKMNMDYAEVESGHQGQGLGVAMYEGMMLAGKHFGGIKYVTGDHHSELAHKLHGHLARKHGLSYKAQPHKGRLTDSEWQQARQRPWAPVWGTYKYTIKAELDAYAELAKSFRRQPVPRVDHTGTASQSYDYSHLLPKNSGLKLIVEHSKHRLGNSLDAKIYGNADSGILGEAGGTPMHNGIFKLGGSELDSDLRGSGIGMAMYEALFTHAVNALGCHHVKGGVHSDDAHAVHQRLAAKHGLSYEAEPNYGSNPNPPMEAKPYATKRDWEQAAKRTAYNWRWRGYQYTIDK